MTNTKLLGAGAALALLALAPAIANAQVSSGSSNAAPPPSFNAHVAANNCAPADQAIDATGKYLGCNLQAPATTTQAALPPGTPAYLMVPGANGPQGGPGFLSAQDVLARYGANGLNTIVTANTEACNAIAKNEKWDKVWSIIRPIITVASVIYGAHEFGDAYGVLLGVGGLQGGVDHAIYRTDAKSWRKLTLAYCELNGDYTTKYGASLKPAPAHAAH